MTTEKRRPVEDPGGDSERAARCDPTAFLDGLSVTEQLAYRTGFAAGYRTAQLEQENAWLRLQAERPSPGNGPSLAELERRRWGAAGREHFADPRPGDYPGRLREAS